MTVLYGSSVADTTLTTACKMATASGGTETSKASTYTGAGNFGEVYSQGNANITNVSAIPAPTGHGWIYFPGAGTFALGNWSPVITIAETQNDAQTFRIYKRSSAGVYTSIGSITYTPSSTAKTTYTLTPTSMPATTFTATDGLYFDLWYQDSFGAASDTATIYESSSSTAGVANDFQITTSTWTPSSSGNTIVGLARAKYLESIASSGKERAKFLVSKAQKASVRDTFKLSIGSKQAVRSVFVISKASVGRSRSIFVESIKELGRGRSRFYSAAVSKGQARSRFLEAIPQKAGARARFLLSIPQKLTARARFLLSIGQKAASRASYLISKASRGLARSKFVESIAQKGRARSKFSLSAAIKGFAESTFKIAVAGGHAITAYMRSKYKVSIKQAQVQRSRFLIRFSQAAQARSRYLVRFAQAAQALSRFLTRFGVIGRARSRSLLAIRQSAAARSRFLLRIAQAAIARSRFLVHGILVTLPIKSITHAVSQVLSTAWSVLSALGLSSSHAPALTIAHQELAMPAPNSTILPTITVTDINGALVSNASAVSLVVYFPDNSSTSLSLGSGITNLGGGQYQAKYNTKQAGEIREVWSIVGADGTTLASAQFLVGVEY